jgi:hypothetical protein
MTKVTSLVLILLLTTQSALGAGFLQGNNHHLSQLSANQLSFKANSGAFGGANTGA